MRAPQYGSKGKRRQSHQPALPPVAGHNPKRDQFKSRNERGRSYLWASVDFSGSVARPKARTIGRGLTGKPLQLGS